MDMSTEPVLKVLDTCLQQLDPSNEEHCRQIAKMVERFHIGTGEGAERKTSLGVEDSYEELLDPKQRRFVMFPIKEKRVWDMYKLQQASFWKAEEIDFSRDRRDYETLNDGEKQFIKMVLAFFAASDGIVNFNLEERFTREIQKLEANVCYDFQKMIENIHSEVYSLMLDNIISDPEERERLFNAIETIPAIKLMADWAFTWIQSDRPFAFRVVAFAFVEGVFFSGAFAAIFWLKKYKNKGTLFLEGLIKSNEFISRDEGFHCDFGCLLYSMLNKQLTQEQVSEIAIDAVDTAINFTNESLRVDLIGMNKDKMAQYIRFVGDRLLVALGHKKIYNVTNPFKFIESISLFGKTNFFESRPTEYQDSSILNKTKQRSFNLISDF